MISLSFEEVIEKLKDKTIAVVGSAPSVLKNKKGYIDSYDIVIRINNYKCIDSHTGYKTNVVYSFWGNSIHKSEEDLKRVDFLMCKCPSCYCHESADKTNNFGGDFKWIYNLRGDFFGIPVYIPEKERYMEYFELLGKHVPTTGFACILEILRIPYKELYITGFDFFKSKLHNVNELWRVKNPNDPVRHLPEVEKMYIKKIYKQGKFKIDKHLKEVI